MNKRRKVIVILVYAASFVFTVLIYLELTKKRQLFDFYDNQLEHLFKSTANNQTLILKNCSTSHLLKKSTNPTRILCTVLTHSKNFNTSALAVNLTWGPACDTLLFVTSEKNAHVRYKPKLNYAFLPHYKENYSKLTIKTIKAILYVYANYRNSYDWMLKADDDTFIIMDNLKAFLKYKCVDEPYVYGYRIEGSDMNSGGAGYLINSQTVNAFVEKYYTDKSFCKHGLVGWEDLDIHRCLAEIGVQPGDSRDNNGLERFHSHSYKESQREAKAANKNLSPHSISFHWMKPSEMLELMGKLPASASALQVFFIEKIDNEVKEKAKNNREKEKKQPNK